MMKFLRSLLVGLAIAVLTSGAALAQCGTTAPANKFCGNDTGSSALAQWRSIPSGALTPIGPGTVLGNPTGASAVPIATSTPVLGVASTTQGTLTFQGGTSGAVLLVPQAVAGSPVLTFPNTSGTFAIGATAPLALSATTGTLSITGIAGTVLAGAGPAFTSAPTLGVAGVIPGAISFNGFTSGSITIAPQSVAGAANLTFPNTSGTFAVNATSPLVLSATTGGLTCPTCVTSSGGGAITGTAPISVSAAGVVSINAPYGTLTASNGGIVYSGATNLAILAGTATARQMLQSGVSTTPAWSTAVWPATTAINQILYSDAANNVTGLATLAGGVLNANGSGVPSITRTPVLGLAGTAAGTLGFQNATSGTITITPPAGALGTPTLTLPTGSGTFAVSASAPLAISAAGVVSVTGAAGQVLAGATPAFTATPVLGVAGSTVGTIGFQNATSGTITLSPVTGALGTVTLSLPAATDTLVGKATTDVFTNKTYNAQGTGNVFQLDGVTVTGKAAASDYFAGTSTAKLIAPNVIYQAPTTTTFGSTTTFDFSTFNDSAVILTGNITTMTLTNVTSGKAGTIAFVQDATGSRTAVFNTIFKFAAGAVPSLTTTANAVDILSYACRTATFCVASLMKDVRNP